jgi:choline dehydrogenase-like flavoprotein
MSGAIHRGSELHGDLQLDADVVVVGSGASGAVVAATLAEAGRRVVMLEEGPHVTAAEHGAMPRSHSLRTLWRDGGMSAAIGLGNTPLINVTMGKGIGGSSQLTGGVCFRTPDHVLDTWVNEHGLTELTPKLLEPCFESVEEASHVEEVPVSMRSRSTAIFDRGLQKLGHTLDPTRRNTLGCCGCSRCNFGCPNKAKLSVDQTYVPRALAAGADVFAECLVDRVDVAGDRAIGVSGRLLNGPHGKPGDSFSVRASRVVLACGAAYTPLLLARSGLAGSSRQVGRNMTLHPSVRTFARFDERIDGWKGSLQSAYTDAFLAEGITLISIFVPPSIFAATMLGAGPAHRRRVEVLPHLAMFGGMVHDDGGGRVRRGFGREPVMTYRMDKRDRGRLSRLMRRLGQVFFEAGAREVYLPVIGMEPVDADTFAKLDLDSIPASRIECASQHPLGTCRMGTSPKRSVVDQDGSVWDLRGLTIADGSIVPTSLGVNPQVTVMSMATRLAWKLRELRPDA